MPVSTYSPFRYPGGKACLYYKIKSIIEYNGLQGCSYREPFAGGAGLALKLLFNGDVSDIYINDIDISVWSFWHCVLNRTDELIDKIVTTPVTLEEWSLQKKIFAETTDDLLLGFATLFLNRTNRSGIIKDAGPIGGKKQLGQYKLDCRFNKATIIERIRMIYSLKNQIYLSCLDAVDFLKTHTQSTHNIFFCIDPPYFKKGKGLYTSFYQPEDHKVLSEIITDYVTAPYLITYDNVEEIRALYFGNYQVPFNIRYSLQTKREGEELMILSKGLKFPEFFEKVAS